MAMATKTIPEYLETSAETAQTLSCGRKKKLRASSLCSRSKMAASGRAFLKPLNPEACNNRGDYLSRGRPKTAAPYSYRKIFRSEL
jgi:hypothetical protein